MLSTKLIDTWLRSPIILGSGTICETKENIIKAFQNGAGAAVTRTLRVDEKTRKPFKVRYYATDCYMLNSDNTNATSWRKWCEWIEEIERFGKLIISISARDVINSEIIVKAFEEKHPPTFYELNFSCSHSRKLYGRISYKNVTKSLEIIKELSKRPVFLKLSLDNINLKKLKELESVELVDGYVLSNTIGPGMKIDVKKRKPFLDSVFGGVSGPAIKPLVLAKIFELKDKLKKPFIGVGGIECADDVLEYLLVGCEAVQIYTAAHRHGMKIFNTINEDLKKKLKEMNETIESIKGTLKLENG